MDKMQSKTQKNVGDVHAKSLWRSQCKTYISEKNRRSIISISNLDLILKEDHHFLCYGNAPAFISPESAERLQRMEVSYSFMLF